MHFQLRRCAPKPREVHPCWFYRWGFGVWVGSFMLSAGHDTRGHTLGGEKR
jgi:hypothetical protein